MPDPSFWISERRFGRLTAWQIAVHREHRVTGVLRDRSTPRRRRPHLWANDGVWPRVALQRVAGEIAIRDRGGELYYHPEVALRREAEERAHDEVCARRGQLRAAEMHREGAARV